MLSAIAARAGELLAAALIAAGVCVAAAAAGGWWLKRRLRRRLEETARAPAARVAVTAAGAAGLASQFAGHRGAEWGEFTADGGRYEAELADEAAKGKRTLAELDEEEQSLERLRRWSRAIRTRDLFGAPSAACAERRLKECTGALEQFAEQVYQAREHGGAG